MTNPRRPHMALVGALCVSASLTSCSLSPQALSTFAAASGDGVTVTMEFESALNLPEGAQVVRGGRIVGAVTAITLVGDHVDVRTRLDSASAANGRTVARIGQDTLLGDTKISLIDADTGATRAVSVIPRSHTSSAVPVEQTLAALSSFVNSGSVQRIQRLTSGLAGAVPDRAARLKAVDSAVIEDIRELGESTASIDALLARASQSARLLADRRSDIEYMHSPRLMRGWTNLASLFGNIGVLLPSVGSVFKGGFWLVPMLESLNELLSAGGTTAISLVGLAKSTTDLFSGSILPFLKSGRTVVVDGVRSPSGSGDADAVATALRVLGAAR